MKYLSVNIPGYGDINPPANTVQVFNYQDVIKTAVSIFLTVGVIAALIVFMFGGILWITSEGDKQKIAKARNALMYAAIGLTIMFLSFGIIIILGDIFGVNLINIPLSPSGGPKRL